MKMEYSLCANRYDVSVRFVCTQSLKKHTKTTTTKKKNKKTNKHEDSYAGTMSYPRCSFQEMRCSHTYHRCLTRTHFKFISRSRYFKPIVFRTHVLPRCHSDISVFVTMTQFILHFKNFRDCKLFFFTSLLE